MGGVVSSRPKGFRFRFWALETKGPSVPKAFVDAMSPSAPNAFGTNCAPTAVGTEDQITGDRSRPRRAALTVL